MVRARANRARPLFVTSPRRPQIVRLAGAIPTRFRNAPTVRNPTHRAVTNATFTSGCEHGHRACFRRLCSPPLVSTRRSSADLASSCIIFPRPAPRSSPALRSSISSEGSLLFVVCPSRISTHSVSNETHYRTLLSSLPPPPVHPSRSPLASLPSSVFSAPPPARAHRLSRTRAIKRHRRLEVPSSRSKWRQRCSRARPSLHHPV